MSVPIGQSVTVEAPDFNRRLHLTYTYGFAPDSPESRVPNPPSGSPGIYKASSIPPSVPRMLPPASGVTMARMITEILGVGEDII